MKEKFFLFILYQSRLSMIELNPIYYLPIKEMKRSSLATQPSDNEEHDSNDEDEFISVKNLFYKKVLHKFEMLEDVTSTIPVSKFSISINITFYEPPPAKRQMVQKENPVIVHVSSYSPMGHIL